jgi:hypothetical protein
MAVLHATTSEAQWRGTIPSSTSALMSRAPGDKGPSSMTVRRPTSAAEGEGYRQFEARTIGRVYRL